MSVGIVAQMGNARAAFLADSIRETLAADDVEVAVDAATADALEIPGTPVDELDDCSLVVSIGGDGTFLFTARNVGSVPIMGVNLGEVGFLNAVSPTDAVAAVQAEYERYRDTGSLRVQELPRVRAVGPDWTLEPALNEIVVHAPQRGPGHGFTAEVRVDGSLYTGGHADGVLVATATGSSAYNLSERGPLLMPGVEGLVVTEMCATASMPSLVVSDDAEVVIRVDDTTHAFVIGDGRRSQQIDVPGEVTITLADEPVRVAGPPVEFFDALAKLD